MQASTVEEPTDWGKVYTFLIAHTSLTPDDISNLSIPQVEAISKNLLQEISLKLGIPLKQEEPETATVSNIVAFCNLF